MFLTLQQLKKMKPHTIFLEGTAEDTSDELNMKNSGETLHWVAIRGGYHDWAVYCGPSEWEKEKVASNGDKIPREETIRKLVPCDDKAFELYRH